METSTKFRVAQQIRGEQAEHEAFHAILKLIPHALQDEAIALWNKGTNGAAESSYFRRAMLDELSESDYTEAQNEVHEAWRKRLNIR
jgi:hypothetical protein